MPLVSKTSTYEFDLESVKELFATDLNVAADSLSVEYVIQEVGGNPIRFPGVKTVTKVRVTVRSQSTQRT